MSNALPCGRCGRWQGPIPTNEPYKVGYCLAYKNWRETAEVVPACTEALDGHKQQASDD